MRQKLLNLAGWVVALVVPVFAWWFVAALSRAIG